MTLLLSLPECAIAPDAAFFVRQYALCAIQNVDYPRLLWITLRLTSSPNNLSKSCGTFLSKVYVHSSCQYRAENCFANALEMR